MSQPFATIRERADALREGIEEMLLEQATDKPRDKARADWESANGFANSFARSTFDAERERDVLRARLAEVERERESLQLQLEKVLDGKEGAWMARALDAECERDALKEKYSRPAYAESHRLDSMWQELVRERAEAVFELRRIRERIAALESTAEDARTCAEYVLSDEFADDYESIAEAARRVLAALAKTGGE